jgi:glycosyltransferase involved in cell wall biosynthesis
VTRFKPISNNTALVIPVLNESNRVIDQLRRIQVANPSVDVVVADGGSNDGSTNPALMMTLGVSALLTKVDSGRLSAQLRMAIKYCLNHGYESIVTMDGNGKDGVDGIERIQAKLSSGYDYVQGSRFRAGGRARNTPLLRYLAIRVIHAPLTSLGALYWYTDSTNGFRGFSRRLLTDSRVQPLRECFDSYELLAYLPIRAARLGFRVTEVPVRREYPEDDSKPTKIRGFPAHLGLLKILVLVILGRMSP